MKKIVICCLFLLLTACVSNKPSNFYTLTAIQDETVKIKDSRKLSIGIDYVSVPGYVTRPQIVTIHGENELNLSEFNRWAEPVSNSIQRVIASDMSQLLKNSIVRPAKANISSFNYIVYVEVNKFDGKFNENVVLDAWWTVVDKDGTVVANEYSKFEKPLGSTYEDLVQKQSELINMLAVQIAQKISKLK